MICRGLADVRALADTHQRGSLDITEFTIAMHLIQALMSNHITAVPSTLPPELLAAANQAQPVGPGSFVQATVRRTDSMSSTGSGRAPQLPPKVVQSPIRQQFTGQSQNGPDAWDVTPQDKANFDNLFRGIDTTNKGYIDGYPSFSVSLRFRPGSSNILSHIQVTGRSPRAHLGFSRYPQTRNSHPRHFRCGDVPNPS